MVACPQRFMNPLTLIERRAEVDVIDDQAFGRCRPQDGLNRFTTADLPLGKCAETDRFCISRRGQPVVRCSQKVPGGVFEKLVSRTGGRQLDRDRSGPMFHIALHEGRVQALLPQKADQFIAQGIDPYPCGNGGGQTQLLSLKRDIRRCSARQSMRGEAVPQDFSQANDIEMQILSRRHEIVVCEGRSDLLNQKSATAFPALPVTV